MARTSIVLTMVSFTRAALVVGVGTVVLGGVPSAHANEWSRPSEWGAKTICAKRKCTTIRADAKVRVFRATDRHGYDMIFGEWRPTRQITETGAGEGSLVASALTGANFAYAVRPNPREGFEMVNVEHLRPGHQGDIGGGWQAAENLSGDGVRSLVVTASGKVAWLIEGHFWNPAAREMTPSLSSRAILCAAPRTDEPAFLAYGPGISSSALRTDAEQCFPVRNPKYHEKL
jgi:hypothetical protein